MDDLSLENDVGVVRQFNRFFTRHIGVLREGLLHTPYSLTEARLLYELAHRTDLTASDLCRELGLDPGYLSRILAHFEEQGLLEKIPAAGDRRRLLLSLTVKGRGVFAALDQRSRDEASELLKDLDPDDRHHLLAAMQAIQSILSGSSGFKFSGAFFLRQPEPGDFGWVVHQHGLVYAREYGWDARFEALVAQIISDFITNFDPARERGWIAEMNGERVGCIFLVRKDDETAKLRMLLVDPKARGSGLGSRLVEECIRFARKAGYKKMTLWTYANLVAARHIYEKTGFRLVAQEPDPTYAPGLVNETWELML
jgi:DNA-binding MarR family transcriptional regulator/N-acetylglutamate synthase-like GNAT family acetyltransferase